MLAAAKSTNVDDFWNSQRIRRVLIQETGRHLGQRIHLLAWRHIIAAIIRQYSRDQRVHTALDDMENAHQQALAAIDDPRDLGFGHSTYTGERVYGRGAEQSPFQTISEQDAFRRVSIEWHQFLQFESAIQMVQRQREGLEYPIIDVDEEVRERQRKRWKALQRLDLDKALRQFMGAEARFRGQQKPIIKAIVQRKSPIVAIMGTGGGKSLLFMLPAFHSSHGLTVVIVPLVALRENMVERGREKNMDCQAWNSRDPPDGAQIVLVTPEGSTTEAFHQWMNRERAMGRLDRIVVDECHVILDSQQRWRDKMRDLIDLSIHETQLIYLTATLAPRDEKKWMHLMNLREDEIYMFRSSTNRPNIRYQVQEFAEEDEEETIQKLVSQKKEQYPLPGQIIIYCRRVEQTERLANVLECTVYHRSVGDAEKKRIILKSLTTARRQVFTATNALGLGIDRSSIRVVIHMECPFRLRDFAQESGRAGRDGQASESIILLPCKRQRGRKVQVGLQHVEDEMKRFINEKTCRRKVLNEIMDGEQQRERCYEDEEPCDQCQIAESRSAEAIAVIDAAEPEAEVVGSTIVLDEPRIDGNEEYNELLQSQEARTRQGKRVREVESTEESGMEEQEQRERMKRVRRQLEIKEEGEKVGELERYLEEWHEKCPICAWRGRENISHQLEKCQEAGIQEIKEEVYKIQSRLQFERYAACFRCGMPQSICQKWKRTKDEGFRQGDKRTCQYRKNFVAEMVVVVIMEMRRDEITQEAFIEWIEQEEGAAVGEMDEKAMIEWYGQRLKIAGIEMSRLVRMFIRCCQVMESHQEDNDKGRS